MTSKEYLRIQAFRKEVAIFEKLRFLDRVGLLWNRILMELKDSGDKARKHDPRPPL